MNSKEESALTEFRSVLAPRGLWRRSLYVQVVRSLQLYVHTVTVAPVSVQVHCHRGPGATFARPYSLRPHFFSATRSNIQIKRSASALICDEFPKARGYARVCPENTQTERHTRTSEFSGENDTCLYVFLNSGRPEQKLMEAILSAVVAKRMT